MTQPILIMEAKSGIGKCAADEALSRKMTDNSRQEAMIMENRTGGTIVRPTILTNNTKSNRFQVLRDPSTWRMGMISRRDVAPYLIDAVTDNLDVKSDVVLTR